MARSHWYKIWTAVSVDLHSTAVAYAVGFAVGLLWSALRWTKQMRADLRATLKKR